MAVSKLIPCFLRLLFAFSGRQVNSISTCFHCIYNIVDTQETKQREAGLGPMADEDVRRGSATWSATRPTKVFSQCGFQAPLVSRKAGGIGPEDGWVSGGG